MPEQADVDALDPQIQAQLLLVEGMEHTVEMARRAGKFHLIKHMEEQISMIKQLAWQWRIS